MTIINGYCTLADVRADLPEIAATDTQFDARLELCVASASRKIDGFTGRRFWQDATVTDRQYYPADTRNVEIDDVSTATGLILKVDINDTGTYDQTLIIATNFILLPANAGDQAPIEPFTAIRLVDYGISWFPRYSSGRPTIQVTAKFGWPAVPDVLAKACRAQAILEFSSPPSTEVPLTPLAKAALMDFIRDDLIEDR